MPAPQLHPFSGQDLAWLVDLQARRRAERIFLAWEPFEGEAATWTYAAFAEQTRAVAAGLAAQGIGPGDVVALHLDNCPEFLFAWFACSRVGAVAVTTNTNSTEDELGYFLSHSRAVAAVTQPRHLDLVRRCGPGLRWIACTATDAGATSEHSTGGALAFSALIGDPALAPVRRADPLAPNSVQYTSGTTSRPKGVVWTHANALWSARVTAAHMGLTEDDATPVFFPLFHTNALAYSTLATLWSGGKVVLTPKFSARRFWDLAVRHRCTWANMVMFPIQALRAHPVPASHDFRFWACPAEFAFTQAEFGVAAIGQFGMTETVSQVIHTVQGLTGSEGSMGRCALEYELAIRGDDGVPAAAGETGRLWVRGTPGLSLFAGYLHDPEATAAGFDIEGWFDTGDEVRADAAGQIFYVGRAKDMLKVGAENVAAIEIEQVINAVPGVLESAVVGKPDPLLDETPVAFVVAQAPSAPLAAEIHAACEAALSSFKRPREIRFVEALPKGLLGKVLKKALREQLGG